MGDEQKDMPEFLGGATGDDPNDLNKESTKSSEGIEVLATAKGKNEKKGKCPMCGRSDEPVPEKTNNTTITFGADPTSYQGVVPQGTPGATGTGVSSEAGGVNLNALINSLAASTAVMSSAAASIITIHSAQSTGKADLIVAMQTLADRMAALIIALNKKK